MEKIHRNACQVLQSLKDSYQGERWKKTFLLLPPLFNFLLLSFSKFLSFAGLSFHENGETWVANYLEIDPLSIKNSLATKWANLRMRTVLINLSPWCSVTEQGTSEFPWFTRGKTRNRLLIYDSCNKSGNVELISSEIRLLIRRNLSTWFNLIYYYYFYHRKIGNRLYFCVINI